MNIEDIDVVAHDVKTLGAIIDCLKLVPEAELKPHLPELTKIFIELGYMIDASGIVERGGK